MTILKTKAGDNSTPTEILRKRSRIMSLSKKEWEFINRWSKKHKAVKSFGGKCQKCNNKDMICLDFHHLDMSEKENGLNRLLSGRWSKIKYELDKCILLCANCHSEEHCVTNGRHDGNKREILEALNRLVCEKCGYKGKNLASLDFHHPATVDKKFVVAEAINRNVKTTIEDLYIEISKCVILCRNCHRLEHFDSSLFDKLKDKIIFKGENMTEVQSEIDVNLVKDLLIQGLTQKQISDKFNCAKSTICEIVKRNNLKMLL